MKAMDSIDAAIIKMLQNNSRTSISDISATVNLSVPAVSERVKKLESSGIIRQYTAILNPVHMKKDLTAIVFISLERPKYNDAFISFVQGQEEILECHYLAGDFDYALKVVTENTASLESLLNRIKSVQGIQKTRTIVVLSTVKNEYSITPSGYCKGKDD